MRSFVDALFLLEQGQSRHDLLRVIQAAGALFHDPAQQALRRTFSLWLHRLLRRKMKPTTIDDIEAIDLLEADTMLAERIESWFAEATQKGLERGLEKGRLEGEVRVLTKLIERRFGPLTPDIAERLAQASEAELDAWSETILTAPTLAALFEPPQH